MVGLLGGARRFGPKTIPGTLILLILIVLLPFLVLQAVSYYAHYQDQRAEELTANMGAASSVALTLQDFVMDVLHSEQSVGFFITSLSRPRPSDLTPVLLASASDFPACRELSWVDGQGRVLASSNPEAVGLMIGDQQYFRDVAAGREWTISDLLQSQTGGGPVFVIARGIRGEDGALRAVVAATLDATKLGMGPFPNGLFSGRALTIIDRRGFLVYRRPEGNWTWAERNLLSGQPLVAEALAGKEVAGTLVSPIDKQEHMAGLVPIRSIGWVALADRSATEAMAPVLTDLYRNGIPFALVSSIALAVALFSGRRIVEPIRWLRERTQVMEQGSFGPPVEVAGPVEVQELATHFNHMSEVIQSQRQLLQEANEQLILSNAQVQRDAEGAERQASEMNAIINSVADGLIIYSPIGDVLLVNRAVAAILDYSPTLTGRPLAEQVTGMRFEMPNGTPLPARETPVQRAMRGETVRNVLLVIHPTRDRTVWVYATAAPVCDKDGEIVAVVSTLSDVTRLHELQELQQDLIRTISHDLRNPLTAVLGQAQLLQKAISDLTSDDRARRGAQSIVTNAKRMSVMIQDLVDMARVESRQLHLEQQPVDLRTFLSDLLESAKGAMDVERVKVYLPAGIPPVNADPDRLGRVFVNLLSNALKYSPPETEVVIRVESVAGDVRVSVSDHGEGISAEDLPHIFERFYRTRGARKAGGLGLGLYSSKSLVEAHGGRIWAESEEGKGSTLYFTLPVLPAGDEAAG